MRYVIPLLLALACLPLLSPPDYFLHIGVTVLLHIWRRQMLLSIAGGTIVYMLLVQTM